MAYTRPMVMVFQEYADTSTTTPSASLPPCIIGPCYHIVDAVEDEGNSLYGTYTEAGIESGFFPNNAPGALIDEKSVSFRLKNARVRLHADLAPGAGCKDNCLAPDAHEFNSGCCFHSDGVIFQGKITSCRPWDAWHRTWNGPAYDR